MKNKAEYEAIIADAQSQIKAIDIANGALENGSYYFMVYSDGYIESRQWSGSYYDVKRYEMGNVFNTKAEAQKAADLQRARATVERAIKASGLDIWLGHTLRGDECGIFVHAAEGEVRSALSLLEAD